uniref:Uncharacterized protein n=1 Tax=Panagrolaimus sp. ES5 TaxID=591445 RepID=A0AC34GS88_9BILA
MEEVRKELEENCAKEIPAAALKKFERSRYLYEQFMRDELPLNEWKVYLNEFKDVEIIIALFEHRLGWKKGCFDKAFWKLYMEFLKEKDQILFHSCKYFFAVQPTPICYRLVFGWEVSSKYIEQSLFLNLKSLDFQGLDNLYITTTLDVLTYGDHPKILSNVIPRLYKCDAKYGQIDQQEITINELKFISNGLYPIGSMLPWCVKIVHNGEKLDADNRLWNINFLKANT